MIARTFHTVLFIALATAFAACAGDRTPIKVLLVTGGHGFEEKQFFQVFTDNPGITFAAASHTGTNATVFDRDDLADYDVIVLYDMPKAISDAQRTNFMRIFDKGVGLVVLHHALVSYQHWPEYENIIGGRYPEEEGKNGVVTDKVGYRHDEEVPVVIMARDHPITAGLKDFTIHDEIYWGFRVRPDVTPLITTTLPDSGKPLGWVREQGKSRVVYLQLGHDHFAYENPNYQTLVARGIRWAARR